MANQIIDKALAYIGNWMKTGKPTGYGTNVDITNYTSASNMYTIPSDGIIEINCNYRAGSYIMVHIFNATGTNSSGLVQQSSASDGNVGNLYAQCPVFKGQRVYVQSSNTYSYAYFKPFIYGVVGGVKLKVSSLALMRGWSHEQSDNRQKHPIFGSSVQSGYGNIPVNRFKWVRRCDGHIRERNVCSADSMRHPKWCRTIGLSFGLCNDLKKQNRFYATLLELWHKCGISNYPMDSDHAYSVALPERGCAYV